MISALRVICKVTEVVYRHLLAMENELVDYTEYCPNPDNPYHEITKSTKVS